MKTAAVNKLIDPLRESKASGFSRDDVVLFAGLSEEELASLAAYRCSQNQRTILHRIVMTNELLLEEGSLEKTQFFNNLNHLFARWRIVLIEKDAEKLTQRALDNPNMSFVTSLILTAKEHKLEVGGLSVFEHSPSVASFLQSSRQKARLEQCKALGIAIPPLELSLRRSAVAAAKSSTDVVGGASSEDLPEEELRLAQEQHAHAVKEVELIKKERDFLQRKLRIAEQGHTSTATELALVAAQLAAALEKNRQLQEGAEEVHRELHSLQAQLKNAREQLKVEEGKAAHQVRHFEETISGLEHRVKQATTERHGHRDEVIRLSGIISELESNIDKANAKLSELEDENGRHVGSIATLDRKNRELQLSGSDLRRKYDTAIRKLEKMPAALGFFQLGMQELNELDAIEDDSDESSPPAQVRGARHVPPKRRHQQEESAAAASLAAGSASENGMFAMRSSLPDKDDGRPAKVARKGNSS